MTTKLYVMEGFRLIICAHLAQHLSRGKSVVACGYEWIIKWSVCYILFYTDNTLFYRIKEDL